MKNVFIDLLKQLNTTFMVSNYKPKSCKEWIWQIFIEAARIQVISSCLTLPLGRFLSGAPVTGTWCASGKPETRNKFCLNWRPSAFMRGSHFHEQGTGNQLMFSDYFLQLKQCMFCYLCPLGLCGVRDWQQCYNAAVIILDEGHI